VKKKNEQERNSRSSSEESRVESVNLGCERRRED